MIQKRNKRLIDVQKKNTNKKQKFRFAITIYHIYDDDDDDIWNIFKHDTKESDRFHP